MSNWDFVALAYGLTWTVLAAYAFYVAGRVRRAREMARGLVAGREGER